MYRDRGPERRQGVVYGDPRITRRYGPPGGSGGSSPVQNALLGIAALALFAIAGFFLLRALNAAPSDASPSGSLTAVVPSASSATGASPSPSASVGGFPTPSLPTGSEEPSGSVDPSAEPSVDETVSPEPGGTDEPEPDEPEVEEGPGKITFGRALDRTTFRVVDPGVRFGLRQTFAWRAFLREPAGTTQLSLEIVRLGPDGDEELARRIEAPISDPSFQILARNVRFREWVRDPGTYTVRYRRGLEVLAEGTLVITR